MLQEMSQKNYHPGAEIRSFARTYAQVESSVVNAPFGSTQKLLDDVLLG